MNFEINTDSSPLLNVSAAKATASAEAAEVLGKR
jgi:hypothetical protein